MQERNRICKWSKVGLQKWYDVAATALQSRWRYKKQFDCTSVGVFLTTEFQSFVWCACLLHFLLLQASKPNAFQHVLHFLLHIDLFSVLTYITTPSTIRPGQCRYTATYTIVDGFSVTSSTQLLNRRNPAFLLTLLTIQVTYITNRLIPIHSHTLIPYFSSRHWRKHYARVPYV